MPVVVREIGGIDSLEELAADAESDGHRFVTRMIDEWRDGTNRFAGPGERCYGAIVNGELVGVCGLNRDPYVADRTIGRVRHFYVSRSHRRSGVGTLLLDRILDDARGVFTVLRLRTSNPHAAAFYVARGFSERSGDEFCTHELRFGT